MYYTYNNSTTCQTTMEAHATLDHSIFDRQLEIFCSMTEGFCAGWEEYSATELSWDIHSLCAKASRLCLMADEDAVIQQRAFIDERRMTNHHFHSQLTHLVFKLLTPLMHQLLAEMPMGEVLVGQKRPKFSGQLSDMLPHLRELLYNGLEGQDQLLALTNNVQSIQQTIQREQSSLTPSGEKPVVRFWHLCELYCYASYIYYHFHRLVENRRCDIPEKELERLFVQTINEFADSEEGQLALTTFEARLRFDHYGNPSREVLLSTGRELVKEIPEKLQLCYMNHRSEPAKMATEVIHLQPSHEELKALAMAVAKWNVIRRMVHQIDHPQQSSRLQNTIFRSEVQGQPVDLDNLRNCIQLMARKVVNKNQWFCVWCILKHHNLLADQHFEAFATQMMYPDWFGGTNLPKFRGDNISDYGDYFGETDYRLWNITTFRTYRDLHSKPQKKWSDKLFTTFQRLCFEMDEIFEYQ